MASWSVQPFCTAHGTVSLGMLFPTKIAPLHGESRPPPSTWFLEPTWAHNPTGIDRFSYFCTAHNTVSPGMSMHAFPRADLHPIQCKVPWVRLCQHPKRQLDRFSHFCTAHGWRSLNFTMGHPLPSWGDVDTIYYMVSWAHPSTQPKRHLDQFNCICRAHHCDRPHYSVCNDRPHLST